jgi:hypothetical protein
MVARNWLKNMRDAVRSLVADDRDKQPLIWAAILFLWIAGLCVLPDPRPLGAPAWAVRALRSATGVSEPAARVAASVVLRGIGVGMIGVLAAMALQRVQVRYAAPLLLVATPLVATGAKWINFGYFPILPQLQFIGIVAILGVLAGLALRRSRIALTALVVLAVALFAWGTSTGVSDDLYQAARVTGLHVLENTQDLPRDDDGFARVLEVAFAYAEDNSHGTEAVLPNQAAILALGVLLGDDRVAWVGRRELEPATKQQRAALRGRATIHGRSDLPQHFWVSAALTVLSDQQRSLAVGIAKEMKDSTPGGSGFSFVDMAANKAGIQFAVAATRDTESARAMQLRISTGVDGNDFFPDIHGLGEGFSGDQFQAEYGGLGSARTRAIFAEIDRRVRACEGLQ